MSFHPFFHLPEMHMIGGLLVKFAFIACLVSIVNYFLYHSGPTRGF